MLGCHRFLPMTAMGIILMILVSSCAVLKEQQQCDRLTKSLDESRLDYFNNRLSRESEAVFVVFVHSYYRPTNIDEIKTQSEVSEVIDEIKLQATEFAEVVDELANESKSVSNKIAAIELTTKNNSIIKARNHYVKSLDIRTEKLNELEQIILNLKTIENSQMGLKEWQEAFDKFKEIHSDIIDMNWETFSKTETAINFYCSGRKDGEFTIDGENVFFPED